MTSPARFPSPVRPGDRVGVAALSGPLDGDRLERGLRGLERLGFEPVTARNLASRRGPLAGGDAERLDALHELAAREDLTAVFFARGGYGSQRVLAGVDWDLLARHPRAWIGYSDVTPFLLQIVRRLDLVAFHGPMAAVEIAEGLEPEEEASLRSALAGRPKLRLDLGTVRPGRASGALLGGCLSLLAAGVGTADQIDLDGSILFWEDVDEPPYRLDRMLLQLRRAGALDGLAGMVVGRSAIPEGARQEAWELFAGTLAGTEFPVAFDCPSGHDRPNLTLPLGASARLEAGSDRGLLLVG
ncbi:MAG: LD-carboxypeptidase [Thermoanaerobaculia bacterium]